VIHFGQLSQEYFTVVCELNFFWTKFIFGSLFLIPNYLVRSCSVARFFYSTTIISVRVLQFFGLLLLSRRLSSVSASPSWRWPLPVLPFGRTYRKLPGEGRSRPFGSCKQGHCPFAPPSLLTNLTTRFGMNFKEIL